MVKFKASINPHGQVYLPSEIRQELNTRELEILGNARAIVIFPKGTQPSSVLKSLKVIQLDLQHRADLERKDNCSAQATATKPESGQV